MVCSIKKLGRGKVAGRLVVRASFHYSMPDQAGRCRLVLVLWVWLGGTFRCLSDVGAEFDTLLGPEETPGGFGVFLVPFLAVPA
jgi:hypothetical protein